MNKVGIGIIGCGNISGAYLKAMADFSVLDIRALADLRPEAAQAAAAPLGLRACSVDELLRDDGDRDRRQPHHPRRARRGGAAGASPPASTCTRKSRWA